MDNQQKQKTLLISGAVALGAAVLFAGYKFFSGSSETTVEDEFSHEDCALQLVPFKQDEHQGLWCKVCQSAKSIDAGESSYECTSCPTGEHQVCEDCFQNDMRPPTSTQTPPEGVEHKSGPNREIDFSNMSADGQDNCFPGHEHPLDFHEKIFEGVFSCRGCQEIKTTEGYSCPTCLTEEDPEGFTVCVDCFDQPPTADGDNRGILPR
jgi:hypothetical protein